MKNTNINSMHTHTVMCRTKQHSQTHTHIRYNLQKSFRQETVKERTEIIKNKQQK